MQNVRKNKLNRPNVTRDKQKKRQEQAGKSLTAWMTATTITLIFLPYLSTICKNMRTPSTPARDAALAIQDISLSLSGLPVGDSSDCSTFITGDIQPNWRPYVRIVVLPVEIKS